MASIWVIEWHYDSDNEYGDWYTRIEEDWGYFTSQEAAQAFADEKNGFQKKYDQYLADLNKDFDARMAQYRLKVEQWNAVQLFKKEHPDVPHGLGLVTEPREPKLRKATTFEEFTRNKNYWEPLEIKSAEPVDAPST